MCIAACRRHEVTEPGREATSPLVEASALALHLGNAVGVVPRFSSNHLGTHNFAVDGVYRSFTALPDEHLCIEYNTLGTLALQQTADCLRRILPLGISHPLAHRLFCDARAALDAVLESNEELFAELDTDRFFYCVRPYYKPYRVGQSVYRGANAGDFAGINVIDLLCGLCSSDNPSYAQLLMDKFMFTVPEDQLLLKSCLRHRSFMDEFLQVMHARHRQDWCKTNLRAFLELLDVYGRTAVQHHDYLAKKFIEQPAESQREEGMVNLTASGPPLHVLLRALERLRDLRTAADRDDIQSRYRDVQQLRASI